MSIKIGDKVQRIRIPIVDRIRMDPNVLRGAKIFYAPPEDFVFTITKIKGETIALDWYFYFLFETRFTHYWGAEYFEKISNEI